MPSSLDQAWLLLPQPYSDATPALTLVSSSPNKYSFTYTVPAGTFNALGSWDIHAKFVAGGLNHYSNSDGDTFISTTHNASAVRSIPTAHNAFAVRSIY